jgi:diketogulonate reductase-like aldo/keto reductase
MTAVPTLKMNDGNQIPQLGFGVFSRIRENVDVFDLSLDDAEMQRMASLATGERLGQDPRTFNAR